MNFVTLLRNLAFATMAASLAMMAVTAPGRVSAASAARRQSAKPAACTAAPYRHFDFWAGDWDAFDYDKPAVAVARVRVNRILDGCVLLEDYQDTTGTKGQSFSVYDETRGVWHQTWVTNRGRLLTIEGKLEGAEMILEGSDLTAEGKPRRIRGVWKPADGGVRETAVISMDGGGTWTPWFDLMFRPHKP